MFTPRQVGEEVMEAMKAGMLVPVSTTIDLVVDRMRKHSGKKFVINGYPKAIDQVKAWEERIPVSAVVHLSCSAQTSQVRSASRNGRRQPIARLKLLNVKRRQGDGALAHSMAPRHPSTVFALSLACSAGRRAAQWALRRLNLEPCA